MYDSYLLYIKSSCPFCIKAIDRLEKEGRRYKIIMIDDWVGGCDDLMIHLDHPEKF